MAKKANVNRRFLAFIPFAYTLLVEELAGEVSFFGHKVKRLGLWAMILEFISVVYHAFVVWALHVLYVRNGANLEYVSLSGIDIATWSHLSPEGVLWLQFYQSGIESLIVLVESILFLLLYIGLYKRYVPHSASLLGIAGAFVPFFKPVAVFCLCNREPIDYEAVMRAKREAFRRQQQWGNPYGNPYGNSYGNPNPTAAPQEEKPKDPFEEFAGEDGGENKKNDGGGDFFA